MSTLILLRFDDEDQSKKAFEKMKHLHDVALVHLSSLLWIDVAKDGHLQLETAPHDPAAPVAESDAAAFGQILGSILTTPLFGAAVGGTVDAVVDRVEESDTTPERQLRKSIAGALKPGKWAVIAFTTEIAEAAVRTELEPLADELTFLDLSDDEERDLAEDAGANPDK